MGYRDFKLRREPCKILNRDGRAETNVTYVSIADSSQTCFSMERTPGTSYERLPQGETQNEVEGSRSQSPLSFVRPPIYYGDGPFDPPSSDSDDEGDEALSFIEKHRPSSPGRAEAGADSGSGWIPSADDKVRAIYL